MPEHTPENHRKFLEYSPESFLDWGKNVGHSTLIVVKRFLYMHKVEQQGYKSCVSLMKLACLWYRTFGKRLRQGT